MIQINSIFYKSAVVVLWLLIFGYVFKEYRDLKILEIPPTKLDFDISLIEVNGDKNRGVFYYDTGEGFNKDEVVVFSYSQPQDSGFKHYSISLFTHKKIVKLRFDPLDTAGKVTIKNLVVHRYSDKEVSFFQKDIDSYKKNSIGNIQVTPESVTITAIGDDPYFVLVDNFSKYQ